MSFPLSSLKSCLHPGMSWSALFALPRWSRQCTYGSVPRLLLFFLLLFLVGPLSLFALICYFADLFFSYNHFHFLIFLNYTEQNVIIYFLLYLSNISLILLITQGHPVCQPCRNRPEVRHCPTCRWIYQLWTALQKIWFSQTQRVKLILIAVQNSSVWWW